ncbi:uncharacterized protein LOC141902477 [Tubulanus polymorphus]|uniref:uncharacterized protein LOC141902477 n=1 Tax=Tubulanus polymorphus TaxID=672921 RepID=UPI003DA5BCC4
MKQTLVISIFVLIVLNGVISEVNSELTLNSLDFLVSINDVEKLRNYHGLSQLTEIIKNLEDQTLSKIQNLENRLARLQNECANKRSNIAINATKKMKDINKKFNKHTAQLVGIVDNLSPILTTSTTTTTTTTTPTTTVTSPDTDPTTSPTKPTPRCKMVLQKNTFVKLNGPQDRSGKYSESPSACNRRCIREKRCIAVDYWKPDESCIMIYRFTKKGTDSSYDTYWKKCQS